MTKVLIIEDEPKVANVLRTMLEQGGYEARVVIGGRDGIQSHVDDPVDLIITDIFMPDMDGLEVIQKLRAIDPRTKIIAISGEDPAQQNLETAKKMGAREVLGKPINYDDLLLAVVQALS